MPARLTQCRHSLHYTNGANVIRRSISFWWKAITIAKPVRHRRRCALRQESDPWRVDCFAFCHYPRFVARCLQRLRAIFILRFVCMGVLTPAFGCRASGCEMD